MSYYIEKELIGFINTISNNCSDAYLYDLIVKPSYQGNGAAHNLIEAIKSELKVKGIDNLTLIIILTWRIFIKNRI